MSFFEKKNQKPLSVGGDLHGIEKPVLGPAQAEILGLVQQADPGVKTMRELGKAIKDAEATGEDGPTKLAAVLNDFEAFLQEVAPTWAGTFQTIAADVEGAVNAIVGIYNDFAHAAPAKAAA